MGTLRYVNQARNVTDEVEQIGGESCSDFRL
jgi:hypothetical protein